MDVTKINMKFERFFWKYKYGPKVELKANEGVLIGHIKDENNKEVFYPIKNESESKTGK